GAWPRHRIPRATAEALLPKPIARSESSRSYARMLGGTLSATEIARRTPCVPARDHGCGLVTGPWAVDTSTVFLPVPIGPGAGARTRSKSPRIAAATFISKASVGLT
ncbi:MAG: hypothetical protein ACREA0_28490, partial [bacterium]